MRAEGVREFQAHVTQAAQGRIVALPEWPRLNCRFEANALIEQGFEPASDTLVLGKRADRHQLPNCCQWEVETLIPTHPFASQNDIVGRRSLTVRHELAHALQNERHGVAHCCVMEYIKNRFQNAS